jgi:hypothetical protein
MSIDVGELAKSFRAHYGSGAAALRALGIKAVRRGGGIMSLDEAEPETLDDFLKRAGLTKSQIDEFHRLCEGAEDEDDEGRKPRKAPASGPRYSATRRSAIIFPKSTNSSAGNSTATILKPTAE